MDISVTCSECRKVLSKQPAPPRGKNDVKFISYYTKGTPYRREAQRLESSLRRLGVDYEVAEVPNLGSWKLNARFKATFVRDRVGDRPVVWIDADAIMWEPPLLLMDLDCDFAHTYARPNQLNGALHYWAPTKKAVALAERWVEICSERNPKSTSFVRDQRCLQYAMEERVKKNQLDVVVLPISYCFIFDTHRRKNPGVRPIIEQFQASREFK